MTNEEFDACMEKLAREPRVYEAVERYFGVSSGAPASVAELRERIKALEEAAETALEVLIGCCVPAGGCDDRRAILDAQAALRAALRDTRPLPSLP